MENKEELTTLKTKKLTLEQDYILDRISGFLVVNGDEDDNLMEENSSFILKQLFFTKIIDSISQYSLFYQ
jgi:hypothetical protein